MAFSWYKTVTFDKTKVPSTQTNFPALVSVTDADLKTVGNGGKVTNVNGYDIGFYSDSGAVTKLDWETERYVSTTGEVAYWVRIPSLSSAVDTVIYMFFGDSGISTDQSNKTGVWDSNYKAVYHLPDGTTLSAVDSTSNAYDGTKVNTPTAGAGQIDGAGVFVAASSQHITLPSGPSVANLTAYTISGWVKSSGTSSYAIYSEGASGDTNPVVALTINEGTAGHARIYHRDSSGIVSSVVEDSGSWNNGSWHHFVAVRSASAAMELYVDGTSRGTDLTNAPSTTTVNQLSLAVLRRSDVLWYMDGSIDEVRVSHSVRSANWITTEYNNQSSPSTFETFGVLTASGGGSTTVVTGTPQRNRRHTGRH